MKTSAIVLPWSRAARSDPFALLCMRHTFTSSASSYVIRASTTALRSGAVCLKLLTATLIALKGLISSRSPTFQKDRPKHSAKLSSAPSTTGTG